MTAAATGGAGVSPGEVWSAVSRFLADVWHSTVLLGLVLAGLALVLLAADRFGPRIRRVWWGTRHRLAGRRAVAALMRDPARRDAVAATYAATIEALRGARAWPYAVAYRGSAVTVLVAGDPPAPRPPFAAGDDPRRWTVAGPAAGELPVAAGAADGLVLLGDHEGGALLIDTVRAPGPLVVRGHGRAVRHLSDLLAAGLTAVTDEPVDGPQWTFEVDRRGRVACRALGIEQLHVRPAGAPQTPPAPVVVTEPDVTEPDVTQLDVTEPDVAEPDAAQPDVTGPEAEVDAVDASAPSGDLVASTGTPSRVPDGAPDVDAVPAAAVSSLADPAANRAESMPR